MNKSTTNTRSLRDQLVAVLFNGDEHAVRLLAERARVESGWQRVRGRQVFVCRDCGTHTPEGGSWSRQCCGESFMSALSQQDDE